MPKNEKGLVIVYTGNGKGKTTAALGTAFRAMGYGWKVCIVQFIKGTWKYGEMETVKKFGDQLELHITGRGFYKIQNDNLTEAEHRHAAEEGIRLAREKIISGNYKLVILDEVLVALQTGLLREEVIIELLSEKPESVHLILTGRGATDRIISSADLVTEMKEIKHPFQSGLPAQQGIDF